jgi:hypothetical protein
MPAFDIDTAARYGKGPVRLVAYVLAMAVRDRANPIVLGPDPTSGVDGVELAYFIDGERYLLVPPPISALPRLLDLLRRLPDGEDNRLPLRLGGREFFGRLVIEPGILGGRATINLPILPELLAAAVAIFAEYAGENELALIEFEDADFR